MTENRARQLLDDFTRRTGNLVVLSGAGISAESGIPTFRGKEGYWTVGSRVYQPQEIATMEMFSRLPEQVWRWYLTRLHACRNAEPNAAHCALVEIESALSHRFCLVTQNVDGLHLVAGNSPERTLQIHGSIRWMRCAGGCCSDLWSLPADVDPKAASEVLAAALRCPACQGWARPHVLWFDEYYDETFYRAESAMRAAATADMLIVVGTSGATNLPMQIAHTASRRGAAIVDINPDINPFSEMAATLPRGASLRTTACESLPWIAARIRAAGSAASSTQSA